MTVSLSLTTPLLGIDEYLINNPKLSVTYLVLPERRELVGEVDKSHSSEVSSICVLAEYFEGDRLIEDVEMLLDGKLDPGYKLTPGQYRLYKVCFDEEEMIVKPVSFRIVRDKLIY